MQRRRDVDGLRTVAVGLVVLEHTGLGWVPGGFVGVDIFFVISGFLISSIVFEEMNENRFKLTGFYERRIRRILPALFATLLVALVGRLLLSPWDAFVDEAWVALSAALSVSNLLFASDEQWGAASHLLHTWSLGIEEQFYLVFPLIAMLAFRRSLKLALLFGLLALISFVTATVTTRDYHDYMFYLPHLRAWELLLGVVLAAICAKPSSRPLAEISTIVGLGLIAMATILLSPSMGKFPGPWALLPCFGAVLIIYGGSQDTWVTRLLSTKLFVGIGLISYSLYLWHNVLFGFYRDITGKGYDLGIKSSVLMIAISIMVAWASWRWIEQPFRRKKAA